MYSHFAHKLSDAPEQLQRSLCAKRVDPSSSLTHTEHMSVTNEADFMHQPLPGDNFGFAFSSRPFRSFDQNPPRSAEETLRDLPRGVNVDVQVEHKRTDLRGLR